MKLNSTGQENRRSPGPTFFELRGANYCFFTRFDVPFIMVTQFPSGS